MIFTTLNLCLDAKDSAESADTLRELENIDDEAEDQDIQFVKIADPALAAEYGLHQLPALVYFEDKDPSVYEGKGTTQTGRQIGR